MGKSAKKTTTKDSTQNTVSSAQGATTGHQTVDVPDWLLNPAQQQAGAIGGLMSQGPAAFTPQQSALGKQAVGGITGLNATGSAYDDAGAALQGIGSVGDIKASSLLEGLDQYYNPYKDQVLNPVLNDYDINAGKTRAAQAAQGATGAFRGSRFGVREGETEGELARGRAATEGGLLSDMYTQATGLSGEDAGRRQQASVANQQTQLANNQAALERAQQMAALATARQGDIRDTLGMQYAAGGQQTDFENAQRQYPIEFLNQTGGLLGQMNPGQYFGGSSEGTSQESGTSDVTGHSKEVEKDDKGLLGNIGSIMNLAKSGIGLFGTVTGNPLLAAAGKA